ncbi:MAG: hypothetical protein BroJett018_19640 [Chloroflexota bacterium]|nr:hypothetical protein [Chloroflexota bacterium]GIK64170.1 MAG: hypothetical protein BroJett018_19640 [Chloroflexota bacterium]
MLIVLNIIPLSYQISHAQGDSGHLYISCASDGTLSFRYPQGWSVDEQTLEVMMVNITSGDLSEVGFTEKPVSEIRLVSLDRKSKIYIREIEPMYSRASTTAEWERTAPIDLIGNFGDPSFMSRNSGRSEYTWTDININQQRGVMTYFTRNQYGFIKEGLLLVIEVGNTDVMIDAETRDENATDLESVVFSLAESMVSTRPAPNFDETGYVAPPATYFEKNCVFTFNYSPEWRTIVRSEQVQLFNNEEAKRVHSLNDTLSSEQIAVEVISPTQLPSFFIGNFDPMATPEEILQTYAIAEGLYPNGTIAQMTINAIPVYRLVVITEDEKVEGFIMAYDFGDGAYAIFSARSGEGGLVNFEEQLTQIAESIKYNPERLEAE